jgi:tetratricopeptide (TPR) repeat protein
MSEHSSVQDFESFLRQGSAPARAERNAQLVRHLLGECVPCRTNLQAAYERARSHDYSGAFQRTQQALADFLAPARPATAPAELLLSELQALPLEEQTAAFDPARPNERFAHPDLVKRLIDQSHAVRYQDPTEMLRLAELARHAAEACSIEAAGSEPRQADLRSLGWRQYGNSLRVLGRLREAEEALTMAQRYCDQGTRDPLLRARLRTQTASLRYSQRRFDEAIALGEDAGQIYRELGETQLFASNLVSQAVATLYAGDPEVAVRLLNRAIPLLDPEGDPHVLLAACHNLVRCYIDLGRPEQALSIYSETRDLYKRFSDPLIRLRASWQEGQLLRDLGHLRAAEALLLKARHGFVERELQYDVAMVSLDLAAVYVKLRAEAELKQTVIEIVPIFRSLGVDREALASLLQLQQLANQRQALEQIRSLNARIEQLAQRPASR